MKRFVQFLNVAKSLTCFGVVSAAIAVAGVVGKPAVSVAGSTAALMLIYDAALTTAEARPGGHAGRPHRGGRHVSPRRGRYEHRERAKSRHKHRRRVIRRRHILGFLYVASLPNGCVTTVTLGGIRYYHCGGVYYRPYVDSGTTIYVIKE